jgi:dTDP-4-amino-4,6-dideoxy-D-galactose acyltransferase
MKPETPSDVEALCRPVDWDSEFFGRRIARIDPFLLVRAGMAAAQEWCANGRIECAYLLADVTDQAAHDLAEAEGFRLVDVRLTLDSIVPPPLTRVPADRLVIRAAGSGDVDALKAIARESHRDTRFYADGNFDRTRCDELYERWIANSCAGWADHVLVAETEGVAAGYLTCHLTDGAGRIGLVAVADSLRRRGAGLALIGAAGEWFAHHGAERMSVVTQGRNAAALGLYQAAGMTVRGIQLWFHKWW